MRSRRAAKSSFARRGQQIQALGGRRSRRARANPHSLPPTSLRLRDSDARNARGAWASRGGDTRLEPEQFGVLAAAAATVGDCTAYLAAYGSPEAGWQGTYDHALVTLDDFLDYKPPGTLILEHLLYSPHGAWGVATTDAEYAVAGGGRVASSTPFAASSRSERTRG